jgi:hypothetical protein
MGEKSVVIMLDRLQQKDGRIATMLTKEELGALQPWED